MMMMMMKVHGYKDDDGDTGDDDHYGCDDDIYNYFD